MQLEEYFKSRKESKVPEAQVQQIKAEYSPQTVVESEPIEVDYNVPQAQVAPQTTQVPQAPESKMINLPKMEESMTTRQTVRPTMRQPSSGITDTDLLVGLAPLVTSLFAGGQLGEGVDVAGKYYTALATDDKKRQQTLEDKLMQLELKRKGLSGSKLPTASNLVPVVDADGVTRYKWVSDAADGVVADKTKTGLTFEQRLELQKKSQDFRQEQKDKDKNISAGARFQQKLESDKDFLDYKNQARNSQRAVELLSLGKGVADAGTRTVIAKGLFGDVGNIAVQEAAAISGAPDLLTKYETFKDMFNKGTRFGDTDRADLIEMALMIRERAPGVINKIAMKKAEAEKEISGADVSSVAKALSKDVTTGKVFVKVIYNGRVKQIPIEDYPRAVKEFKAKLFTGKE
jgi:uncharacterized membrane-anchored protein YhcB (DUF1043 family)